MATIRVFVFAVLGAVLFALITTLVYGYLSSPHIPSIDFGVVMFACAGATVGAVAGAAQAIVDAIRRKSQ